MNDHNNSKADIDLTEEMNKLRTAEILQSAGIAMLHQVDQLPRLPQPPTATPKPSK